MRHALLAQLAMVSLLSAATVTVDTSVKYQTWEAWGGTVPVFAYFDAWASDQTAHTYDSGTDTNEIPDDLELQIVDGLVNDLGITRLRFEVGPQVEMTNDNADPSDLNLSAYRFKWQDIMWYETVLPAKQLIEANGDSLVVYVSYDLRSSATPSWLLQPAEYAEMAVAVLTHMRDTYGFVPQYWTTLNEPGNGRPGSPSVVAELIAATGARLQAEGFRTRMSGPEVVTPNQLTEYLNAIDGHATARDYLGQVTYHLYWDPTNVARRNEARDWAAQRGITTAQTEWMEGWGAGLASVSHLDLTEANVSAWEQYSCYYYDNLGWQGDYYHILNSFTEFGLQYNSWFVRQYSRFIRPGDRRVDAQSSDAQVKPVAFVSPSGQLTIVVINSASATRTITVNGIPSGTYTRMQTYGGSLSSTHLGEELPNETADANQMTGLVLPAQSVSTLQLSQQVGTAPSAPSRTASLSRSACPGHLYRLNGAPVAPGTAQHMSARQVLAAPSGLQVQPGRK